MVLNLRFQMTELYFYNFLFRKVLSLKKNSRLTVCTELAALVVPGLHPSIHRSLSLTSQLDTDRWIDRSCDHLDLASSLLGGNPRRARRLSRLARFDLLCTWLCAHPRDAMRAAFDRPTSSLSQLGIDLYVYASRVLRVHVFRRPIHGHFCYP
jgi:hypothetical protein